ncbi:methyltransferase domain-containing protein [Micromonospora terminaliae]|uniref:Class I SAM-dependent methyltransferase n=1 Tax=Micromonospora terminaliae TaxID=1914461 RepID=A0AAJ3DKM4_9ACTN|nr:class I SAM-dependent methyltransferase [Micromonospora terminaliae]NES30017.1 class I SAM-dependent methyltransferase [Micromonospora terminaliae]QGL46808.1 methyltransferase domain-containing protein [Micromonospora terminaliae]
MVDTDFDAHERSRWAGRAEAYARSFGRLCAYPAEALLDAAGVRAGRRVIDVGTGPGTVAALALGRGAEVVAVDAEPSMLDAARRNAPGADVRAAALPDLPVPTGGFDAAVANFVLNHVGDPAAGVAELRRVVRPGGRVAVTVWPVPHPPLQGLWGTALAAAGVATPADLPRLPPERDFPRTEAGFAGLLAAAGLADVRCVTLTWAHRADPEDWWAGPAAGISAIGLVLQRQPPAVRERVRREYDRLAAPYRQPDGSLALPTAALLASARVG